VHYDECEFNRFLVDSQNRTSFLGLEKLIFSNIPSSRKCVLTASLEINVNNLKRCRESVWLGLLMMCTADDIAIGMEIG